MNDIMLLCDVIEDMVIEKIKSRIPKTIKQNEVLNIAFCITIFGATSEIFHTNTTYKPTIITS
jgi:hypothetical protein